MISTASARLTVPSQLASPYIVTDVLPFVVVVVVVDVEVVVVVVVVVVVDVVVVDAELPPNTDAGLEFFIAPKKISPHSVRLLPSQSLTRSRYSTPPPLPFHDHAR